MIREIAPRVFVETEYHGANVAFVVTGEGVILIDTPMLPNEARLWWGEILKRTDQEILYIINTDHHRAHVIGNQFFPTATVVAHEHAWKEMKSYGDSFRTRLINMYRDRIPEAVEEWKEHLEIIKPEITFTGRTIFFKGDKEIHMIPVGGHTPATTVVLLPEEKLLFAGDVVVTNRPPFLSQGNTKQWLEALTYLRKINYDVLIPGHAVSGPFPPLRSPKPIAGSSRAWAVCGTKCEQKNRSSPSHRMSSALVSSQKVGTRPPRFATSCLLRSSQWHTMQFPGQVRHQTSEVCSNCPKMLRGYPLFEPWPVRDSVG
jgi:glyoxylase-like metal-dependent hydrolase (beta-lactamase superfamily II)